VWSPDGHRLTIVAWDPAAQDVRVRFWDATAGYELATQPTAPSFAPADLDDQVRTFLQLADFLRETHRPGDAERAYRDALAASAKLVSGAPALPAHRQLLGRIHFEFGTFLQDTGRTAEAEVEYGRALVLQAPLREQVLDGREQLAETHDELGQLLQKAGRLREAAWHYAEVGSYPGYSRAERLNRIAWFLATNPDPEARDPAAAVGVARRLCDSIRGNAGVAPPFEGEVLSTLGVAHYRNGEWKEAVAALEESIKLRRGGDRFDFFFLAMAYWQLGKKEDARRRYDKAVQWMDKNKPKDAELHRFRAEASALLGIKDSPN